MKKFNVRNLIGTLVLAMLFISNSNATVVECDDTAKNYMQIDSSTVNSCLDSGTGNINGNVMNDAWLTTTGAGYVLVSKDDASNPFNIITTQNGSVGTWSIDASYWNSYNSAALGFKFGTGNKADEWFIFDLVVNATSGDWKFINTFNTGGGLSHTNLYSNSQPTDLAEPAALALFGLSLLGLALARRSMRSK